MRIPVAAIAIAQVADLLAGRAALIGPFTDLTPEQLQRERELATQLAEVGMPALDVLGTVA